MVRGRRSRDRKAEVGRWRRGRMEPTPITRIWSGASPRGMQALSQGLREERAPPLETDRNGHDPAGVTERSFCPIKPRTIECPGEMPSCISSEAHLLCWHPSRDAGGTTLGPVVSRWRAQPPANCSEPFGFPGSKTLAPLVGVLFASGPDRRSSLRCDAPAVWQPSRLRWGKACHAEAPGGAATGGGACDSAAVRQFRLRSAGRNYGGATVRQWAEGVRG